MPTITPIHLYTATIHTCLYLFTHTIIASIHHLTFLALKKCGVGILC